MLKLSQTVLVLAAVGALACVGSAASAAPLAVTLPATDLIYQGNYDDTLNKFNITGGAVAESSLAPFPGYMPAMGTTKAVPSSIASGDCLMGITGVVDYFFDYLLLNTSTAAVVTGGTGCPVAEGASHAVCSDNIDNDGNGFSDCMDNGCIVGDAACRTATTITAIQTAIPTGPVELQNVYITGISNDKKSIWVATNLAAAVNEGIYVFRANNGALLDNTFAIGSKVNVIGTAAEFNDDTMGGTLTEITGLKTTLVTTAGTVVPVVGQTAATLSVAGTAPMYESVLVTLTNLNLTALGNNANGFIATATQSGTTFKVGTDVIRFVAADVGCHATMTGLWTNLQAPNTMATMKPNAFGFIPTSMSVVSGATCP